MTLRLAPHHEADPQRDAPRNCYNCGPVLTEEHHLCRLCAELFEFDPRGYFILRRDEVAVALRLNNAMWQAVYGGSGPMPQKDQGR